MNFPEVEMEIVRWLECRKIIPNSSPEVQLLKAVSELGELADATIKKDHEEIVDSVGDVMVCLISYCALQNINITQCMEVAYAQIKHRKGMLLPNGVFVKN
jgi:NTP pyrophosphatase (non-canonical NTP hydrolase)